MPTIKILPNGVKTHVGHGIGKHTRVPRRESKGWTKRSSKANRDFLFSIEVDQLTGNGYALTLTLRDCPATARDWHALRRAWIRRMERAGMLGLHWITEWQKRGHPHIHGAIFLPDGVDPGMCIFHWLEAAKKYHARAPAQDIRPLTGAVQWFEYLAKHAARGVSHYQRHPENIPPGWEGKTGRVWGYVGHWPISEGKQVQVNNVAFYQHRRLQFRYLIAKAKRQGDHSRARYLRRRLQMAPEESRLQGVGEFIPESDTWALLACAMLKDGADHE